MKTLALITAIVSLGLAILSFSIAQFALGNVCLVLFGLYYLNFLIAE